MPIKLPRSARAATSTRPTCGRSARPARRCSTTSSSTRPCASARTAATTSGCGRGAAATCCSTTTRSGEHDAGLESVDPLGFVDQKPYPDRLAAAQTATGMRDAAVWGTGAIAGHRGRDLRHGLRVHGRLDGRGRRREGDPRRRARPRGARSPLIVVSASGGARMQEGTLALMQLAKTRGRARAAARRPACRSSRSCTDPTTGGVFASFAAAGRRQPRRAQRAHRLRRRARRGRARSPRSCRRASSAPSSCSSTASSTGSCRAPSCATSSPRCCATCRPRRLVRRHDEPIDDRAPGFRPFSFLTTLADRVGEGERRRPVVGSQLARRPPRRP